MKILSCSTIIFIITLCVYLFDIQINTTSSIPIGIYTLDRNKGILGNNKTILFCLNNEYAQIAKTRGYLPVGKCKNGLSPIGKHIVASANDFVEITKYGIYVNGKLLPKSKPMPYDSNGRILYYSKIKKILNKDEFLVASLKKDSFDSRYYGIVGRKEILGVLKELVII
ncbi:conjugative transfer signal peptidase TraF [Succinivibrio dextrinosolvens]|uniref:conjugative transfer signal peptidase TraF n=1 Tax=Succinivibrio dextrinosolvens TaxID=83771 RepID=UPI00241C6E4B|nr:conjugative transfer signal peptidase TraF [Succinivibrio dextrinosolvens]MBE6422326.1 conjugative transfer signal peptidase TraF [Succinivibrio dextrinosolvens]